MNEIQFTQGNYAKITLYAEDEFGAPLNLTGATFSTDICGRTAVSTFDDDHHDIVDADKGQYTLELTAEETALIEVGQGLDILSTVTQGGKPITYRGMGVLQVFAPAQAQAPAGQTNIFMGAAL